MQAEIYDSYSDLQRQEYVSIKLRLPVNKLLPTGKKQCGEMIVPFKNYEIAAQENIEDEPATRMEILREVST